MNRESKIRKSKGYKPSDKMSRHFGRLVAETASLQKSNLRHWELEKKHIALGNRDKANYHGAVRDYQKREQRIASKNTKVALYSRYVGKLKRMFDQYDQNENGLYGN